MNKEEFLQKILDIGTCTDDIERRSMLTDITDQVSKIYDDNTSLNTTIESLNSNLVKVNSDLEKAQKANMELFLRVGSKDEKTTKEEITGEKQEPEKRKFEDLFKGDEK